MLPRRTISLSLLCSFIFAGSLAGEPDSKVAALSAAATATPTPPTLRNISTRVEVGIGSNVPIAGFMISGTAPKKVLIRGIGPSLARYGVVGSLADPQLELHDLSSTIATNDDWQVTHLGGVIQSNQVAEWHNRHGID